VADDLDIPPYLDRRAKSASVEPLNSPADDAEASARRRKADYALMEAIEGGYLDELEFAIAAHRLKNMRAAA
jgi:hypothetical protein